jgi:hypothetical protein
VIPIGIFDTHPTLTLQGILSIYPTIDVTILGGTMVKMIIVIKSTRKWFVIAYATMTCD